MSTRQSQKALVLNALRGGPKTTWQLGYELGICCVTKRISELRAKGHVITTSEKHASNGKRIVTYTLQDPSLTAAPQNEHVNGLGERVGECSNCHGPVYRQPKARPPLPDEQIFCQSSCRDAYWNKRRKSSADIQRASTGFPQPCESLFGDL